MDFNGIAPHYHWLERLFAGRTLQRCRTAWLEMAVDCREVLLVGEGDGRFLEQASRQLPEARFTCVDGSVEMLRLAEIRCPRAEFIAATLPGWEPPVARYDLVVTHFFLDCLEPAPLAKTVAKLAKASKPDALWLMADFQVPEKQGMGRLRAKLVLKLAYAFFRLTTGLKASRVTNPEPFLEAHGFQRVERRTWEWGMLVSDVWKRSG